MEPICSALHPYFKNASQKARSPTRAMASQSPLNFVQLDVPSTPLVGDWVRLRQACPHQNPSIFVPNFMLACTFMADKFVVQNHGIIIAQFSSLRPASLQRAMRREPPPGYSPTARSQADNHNGADALALKVHQKDKHAHTTQRCDQTTWIQKHSLETQHWRIISLSKEI